jgi:hypothetical protein
METGDELCEVGFLAHAGIGFRPHDLLGLLREFARLGEHAPSRIADTEPGHDTKQPLNIPERAAQVPSLQIYLLHLRRSVTPGHGHGNTECKQ